MNRRRLLSLTVAAAAGAAVGSAAAAPARKVEGFTFPGEVTVAGTTLHLNGVGLKQVAWLKGYAAALYLPQVATTTKAAVTMPGPKRVAMRMMIDGPSAELAKAFQKGVSRNLPLDQQVQAQPRAARFDAIVRGIGKLKKGDLVEVEFRPDEGMVAMVNGRAYGEPVPGVDLFNAMLLIYIGDRPTDEQMKVGLLGGVDKRIGVPTSPPR